LSADLERIINKALEKERDLRYQHASDIRTDLQRLKRDTESTRIAAQALPKEAAKHRNLWIILAVIITVIGMVALGRASHHSITRRTPPRHPSFWKNNPFPEEAKTNAFLPSTCWHTGKVDRWILLSWWFCFSHTGTIA